MTPAIEALIAEAERLDKEATDAPWSASANGIGAVYLHAEGYGAPKTRHGSTYRPLRKMQIGKMYDAHGGRFPGRPDAGRGNAEFAARARTLLPALASALRRAERVVEAARVLDRLATPPMQSAAWDTLDAALRAHDHPDATGGTGREGGS